jgi:ABC-type glycerol-3-phosphate transport system permease component
VSIKKEPLSLRGIRVLAVVQVIAVWVGLVLSLSSSSSRVVTYWAILCGTGAILGALGLWEKVWAAVLLGFLISPTIFLGILRHMPRDNDPKDLTA